MSYLKEKTYINVDNDISIVDPEIETKNKFTIASEILEDAFFSQITLFLTMLIEMLNLCFIGHYLQSSNGEYLYTSFNFFQIGTVYIYLFELMISISIIKYLKNYSNFEIEYVNNKLFIYLILFFLIIPFSLMSYLLLNWFYKDENNQNISNNLWKLSTKFLYYSPLFIFFYLMFLLNLNFYLRSIMRSVAAFFCFLFILIHVIISYTFIYLLERGIEGITLSLIITSILCYIFSNIGILEGETDDKKVKNFFFIPNQINLNDNFKNFVYDSIKTRFTKFLDYLPYGLFSLFSFFIGNCSFTLNIILINVLFILKSFSQGLSSTLKTYISYSSTGNKHSHQAKVKYVKVFTFVTISIALIFSLIFLTFGVNIVYIYISSITVDMKKDFKSIKFLYTFVILLDFISKELEGYVRGIKLQNNLVIYKIVFPLIFIPAGFALTFFFDFGLFGLWIGILLYILFYLFPNSINVYRHYDLFFQR